MRAHSEQSTNVDVVRFPCVVYINEVRVIPPGVRAHSNLPESRAYGETSPHTFQLDLFFNNVSKPSAPVFDRLGSLEYDENSSIIFRPNAKVNTDGLVLRGWYNCLTLAIYGSVDRVVSHDRDSPPPPPPPPPPPQQQTALKRTPKPVDGEKEDQFNGSPPRPQPRGPRTPPGPPPPDDDEDEPMPVSGESYLQHTSGISWRSRVWRNLFPSRYRVVGEKDDVDHREDYFEPISPDRASIHQEGPYSDEAEVEEDHPEEVDDDEEGVDVEEEEEDDEDDDDGQTVESIPEDEEEDEEEEDDDDDEEDAEEEEEGEGDDGYEQISSDEDGIADLERETFKYPSFDIEYTAEDLARVPPVTYDPFDRELGPLLYFGCPYKTTFETEVAKMRDQDPDKDNLGAAETSAKLTELLELYQEERGAKWVTALEEIPSLMVKGLSYLQSNDANQDYISQLVDWTMQALNLQVALRQPIALNVRQLKAGTKLVSSLAECGPRGITGLLQAGVVNSLFELLFADHVSSSLKLNAFKALDSVVSMTEGMEVFLRSGLEVHQKSGYQRLLELIVLDQTVRVVTAGSAILQKCHFYEILSEVKKFADQLAENSPSLPNHAEPEQDADTGLERGSQEYENDVEAPMDMDNLLESSSMSEGEVEKLINLLDEILHLMETAPHTMIQPPVKSFPTTARITGPPERDDPFPVLFRYLHNHHFLESITLLLSNPITNVHPGVLQSARDILRFLAQSQKGLLFFLSEYEATNLLVRAFCQFSDPDQEEGLQTDGSSDEAFPLWLLHSTQSLQCISELFCHFQRCTATDETDHSDLLGTLHNLYLITFNPVGRAAVAHVFSLEKNLQSLITLMEFYSKEALGKICFSDSKSKKSVAYNYACILILLVVQSSSDVQMLEQYSAPLLKLCKADENNTKLQELGKWLEPLKTLRFEINCIPNLIEYIKQNIDSLMTQEGVGLPTALRVLCHIACPPPPVEGQQKDLKWNLAVIQLFSSEGMDTFIRVLQKLNSILIQPWRLHVNMGTTLHRVTTISMARCTLTLLKTMLIELLRGGSFEFKDMRVPSALISLHMLLCSIPLSGRLDSDEQKIQNDIVDILLTFTQGVNEKLTISEETLANNTWSLMLKEVLTSVLRIPEGFFSGLILLSELLPLPLPMQTTQVIELHDISVALNTRKLWSMHLHVQAKLLQEIVRSFSGSTCQPIQHMLRRICVQLCDLASPTALLIMRTVLDLLVEDLQSNPEDKEKQYTGQTTRLLALLDALASHKACKLAILHLINGTAKGDEKYAEIFPELLSLMRAAGDNIIHQQCTEYVASILQSLCDQDIALILPSSTETTLSELEQLSNSLPSKELMASICDCLVETFSNAESSYSCLLTCIRTMMFLTEHDYGFYHLKSSLRKHCGALQTVLKRVVSSFNKDPGEFASSFLDFMRQILNSDTLGCCGDDGSLAEVDGAHPARTLGLTTAELKYQLQNKEEMPENLLLELEKLVLERSKEDESLESLLDNVVGLRQMLESAGDPCPLSDQDVEPILPLPESLQHLFNNRTAYVLADVMDDQLKSMWFSPFQAEEIDTDLDMVKVDLIELSEKGCSDFDLQAELERSFLTEPSSPGRTKTTKGFKLGKHKHETFITSSGKSEYIEPAKRAHIVPPPRGRGRGAFGQGIRPHDIFRQRKQNTSRPPSMHVDDFVAAESKEVVPPDGIPPPKRLPKVSQKISSRGGFSGNRGGRGAFHSQNRFFTPPASKGNYSRREGARGSSWSAQSSPRGTYNESRGGQSNFNRGPLPPLRPLSSAGYRPSPRDRASRGRGAIGPSWASANSGGSSGSRGKFVGGGSGRGRHVRSFTR
ncbi:protein virilizer homolog isoform X3 [Rhineura floridana]|uniref:protein virilizer homolog isoform X3 n=1 Tax=Rhineura floridana TaxID=261503 RepID=UPI002AC830D7|nr:protein virilizer homolog isoform X3 [Rhineura floridana]